MQGIIWRRPRECHFKEPRRIVVVLLPRGMATRAAAHVRALASERKVGFGSSRERKPRAIAQIDPDDRRIVAY